MVRIPRYIDTQPQILWWELDEIIVLIMSLFVGILTRQLTYFLLGGFIATYFITKLKNGKSDGFIFHLAYWYISFIGFIGSASRRFNFVGCRLAIGVSF